MKNKLRLAAIAAVFAATAAVGVPQAANATIYQDWWNNTDLSGMGLNVGQQGRNIFVSWYMYDEFENPSFLLFFGRLDSSNKLTAPLNRYFGPEPPAYDENLWSGEEVGTATIHFTSPQTATFSYNYDGQSGSFPVNRYTFSPINLSGFYAGGVAYTLSNCGASNGEYAETDLAMITHSGTDFVLETYYEGCRYEGTVSQAGTHFSGAGDVYCSNGNTGTWRSPDLNTGEFTFEFIYTMNLDNGCRVTGRAGGIK